jgi:ThiF family
MRLLDDHPQRMARERQLLEEHARSTPGFAVQSWSATALGELCVSFALKLLVGTFEGVLVYPELFPDVAAFVRPQKAGERWSSHQYLGSGVLCLQFGPDNWHRDITGVDLIRSATTLLWGEILQAAVPDLGPLPSRHLETEAQALRKNSRRLVITAALRNVLAGASQARPLPVQGTVDWVGGESVAVITATGDPSVQVSDVPGAVAQGPGVSLIGVAVAVPEAATLGSAKDITDLQQRMGLAWPWAQGVERLQLLVAHDATGEVCAFLLSGGVKPWFERYHPLRFDGEAAQRLPSTYSKLATVSVGIVGLGSLGSKIAVSLARAGVRRFLLVDDDVLGPHNLVRNEFNWLDVGYSKVEAGVRALKLVAPGIEVKTRSMKVATQTNPSVESGLAAELTACTLVVDATASASAFVALAALTKRAKTAMVWGEVFGGGGGCLMARSRPGLDADALGVRAHMHGVMKGMAAAPTAGVVDYGLESDGVVHVASDADVSALAASMAQFCLDTLCAEVTDYPVAAYLTGFRKFWEFRCPFDVIPIDCSGALKADPEQMLSPDEEGALAAIRQSIGEGASVANHGSA